MHSRGFTLIELLVVLVIIGILSSIAIPQYNDYKKRAFDARARSDLQSMAVAEEAYFLDAERYISCANAGCTILPGIASLSKGVLLTITGTATGFTGTSTHRQGTGRIFRWNSSSGGLADYW